MRFRWALLLALWVTALGLSCRSVPGPPLAAEAPGQPSHYVENCETCHPAVAQRYRASGHAKKRLACGKCHEPEGHPDFARPVSDGTCAGCHTPQFQQLQQSAHFRTRVLLPLRSDRSARRSLRAGDFVVPRDGRGHFAGDAGGGAPGGRLCAGCHLDGHRFRLAAIGAADGCLGCHDDRDAHFPVQMLPTSVAVNPCLTTYSVARLMTHRLVQEIASAT